MKNKCKCGCGEKVKTSGNIYILGHNSRGKNNPFYGRHHTKTSKEKLSKVNRGKNNPMYGRSEYNSPRYGKKSTIETIRKLSTAKIGKNNPFYGKHHTKETKKKLSKDHIGKNLTKGTRRKISKASKSHWKDPEYQFKMGMIFNSPEYRDKHRERWKDSNYQDRMRKSISTKPNKAEQKLDMLLRELTFGEYKYVGDFQFFLGGRNPDFRNVNGQKKLIELFGDYWHSIKRFPRRQTPEQRIEHFKQHGFDTLIIKEYELKKNLDGVISKILLFNYLDIGGKELL
jgi:very-short-patch-repair endonuclease